MYAIRSYYAHIRKIASEMASSMGANCEVKINDGYPVVTNDSYNFV